MLFALGVYKKARANVLDKYRVEEIHADSTFKTN